MRQVQTDNDRHPSECGEDVAGKRVTRTSRHGDPRFEEFSHDTGRWSINLEHRREELIAGVKATAQLLQRTINWPDDTKGAIYAQKRREVEAWVAADRFNEHDAPYAAAEAALTGRSIGDVLDTFAEGALAFDAKRVEAMQASARIEAIEQDVVAKLREARSVVAMQRIACPIDWGMAS